MAEFVKTRHIIPVIIIPSKVLSIFWIEITYIGLSTQWICLLCCVVVVLNVSVDEIGKVAHYYRSV